MSNDKELHIGRNHTKSFAQLGVCHMKQSSYPSLQLNSVQNFTALYLNQYFADC